MSFLMVVKLTMTTNIVTKNNRGLIGTFALNKTEPIHRWYKYDEGYSSEFIVHEFEHLPIEVHTIFEPFAGSGTTPLVASQFGIQSYFSEINPFMVFVTKTKINTVKAAHQKKEKIIDIISKLKEDVLRNLEFEHFIGVSYDGFEKYYNREVLAKLLAIKKLILDLNEPLAINISKVALASIAVKVSNMIKRGDLRYAKENEKKENDFDVQLHFTRKLDEIIYDVNYHSESVLSDTCFVHADARQAKLPSEVDCVITSPPYLNGTNYIRNTKLELKLLDFVKTEKDLPVLHSGGIMAGINSVSKRRNTPIIVDEVKEYVEQLEPIAYDKRIPIMVAGYFHDMDIVFNKLKKVIRNNGIFVLDIGDSQFAGVHIPTDEILTQLAIKHGFRLYDEEVIRTRRSKNQMLLSQKVLRYQLIK